MKIVVLFPTKGEAKYFCREDVEISISGVGMTATAYSSMKAIENFRPDVVILAGVAGVYPNSNYHVGDCLIVSEEYCADLGFFYPEGFRHISQTNFSSDFGVVTTLCSPYINDSLPLPAATANSANSAMPSFINNKGVDIESMEGFPFFYVCHNEGVEFYEVRAVSNIVDPAHRDWNLELAVKNLAEGLNKLIDYLKNNEKN